MEKTLMIVKPHAVDRGLVGAVLARFENAGMEIEESCVVKGDAALWEAFYPSDEAWFKNAGQKTLDSNIAAGVDVEAKLGTSDPLEIGKMVKSWLVDHMSSGKAVAFILSGNEAGKKARLICGATLPNTATPGTIRFDYSNDTPELANEEKRPVFNIVHASDPEEYRDGIPAVEYEAKIIFGHDISRF